MSIEVGAYWNSKGAHQADYKKIENLVPGVGSANTLQGEILRAVTRIYYDLYNNGMGGNWEAVTSAMRFLERTPAPWLDGELVNSVKATYMANNERGHARALEMLIDDVVVEISRMDPANYTPFDGDMFDYTGEEPPWVDEEDDRWDDMDDDDMYDDEEVDEDIIRLAGIAPKRSFNESDVNQSILKLSGIKRKLNEAQ